MRSFITNLKNISRFDWASMMVIFSSYLTFFCLTQIFFWANIVFGEYVYVDANLSAESWAASRSKGGLHFRIVGKIADKTYELHDWKAYFKVAGNEEIKGKLLPVKLLSHPSAESVDSYRLVISNRQYNNAYLYFSLLFAFGVFPLIISFLLMKKFKHENQ